jgi:hypothetical protein
MKKETFNALLAEVEGDFPIGQSSNGKNISTAERLLAFLMFLSGDKTVWDQEFAYEFGTGSVVKTHKMVIDILFDTFVGRHIHLPTTEEAIQEAKIFRMVSGFPATIFFGAVDGTHVELIPPKNTRILYRYVSIVTLLTLTTEHRGRLH